MIFAKLDQITSDLEGIGRVDSPEYRSGKFVIFRVPPWKHDFYKPITVDETLEINLESTPQAVEFSPQFTFLSNPTETHRERIP